MPSALADLGKKVKSAASPNHRYRSLLKLSKFRPIQRACKLPPRFWEQRRDTYFNTPQKPPQMKIPQLTFRP